MRTEDGIRAYAAGACLPTLILPLLLAADLLLRMEGVVRLPVERALVFPMALVPVLWGLWNVLWLAIQKRRKWPLGLHGALLPLLLMSGGAAIAAEMGILRFESGGVEWFGQLCIRYAVILLILVVIMVVYLLLWRFVVVFLNRLVGIG